MHYVAVLGSAECSSEVYEIARAVGQKLAAAGVVVICGGRGGVMEGVARGATEKGGTVIGLLPGTSRCEGNPFLTYSIPTAMGNARNAIIAQSCDVAIAIAGGFGTLSEIGLCLKAHKPVVGLGTWDVSRKGQPPAGFFPARDPQDAVAKALELIGSGGGPQPCL